MKISILDIILVGIGATGLLALCEFNHMPLYYPAFATATWALGFQYEKIE